MLKSHALEDLLKKLKCYARKISVSSYVKTETTQGKGDYTCITAMNDSFRAKHANISYYHKACTRQQRNSEYNQVWTDFHHKGDFTSAMTGTNEITENNRRCHVMLTKANGSV